MDKWEFETMAIRTQVEQSAQKEHSVPLYLTSSFTFDNAEEGSRLFNREQEGNLYSRFSNPNTDEFIQKLCLLEGAEAGIATASGMAAVYTSFSAFLKQGDHVIASKAIFGNTQYILSTLLPNMGIQVTMIDMHDYDGIIKAVQPNTKMLYLETPSNPTLQLWDLRKVGDVCKLNKIIFSVDNCFATPYLQQPISFGADLVIHSATKYIDGQGRVLGGAVLGSKELISPCYEFIRRTGAALSPFNAWVLSKSLETLAVRMDRHAENALAVANYLSANDLVEQVTYPFLDTHPQYEIARTQMKSGGGLVGCVLKGGLAEASSFLNALKLHSLTANLGDTRSIATHPASTTHSKLTAEEQAAVDILPSYLRFSVGLENVKDIIADIEQALISIK